ncbi:divalent-cation tolerance protein CutA [Candidatus Woesearchaeota archaeon]|nr:divalent-cation tolerance protein CutA [Candidatus Woesearchaeota archaeon]
MSYSLVYTTVKDLVEAKKMIKKLMQEKLIACVNLFPITSMYPWKGRIQSGKELALLMKTQGKLVKKVIQRTKDLHSYEVPCVISWSIRKGNDTFLKWVKTETK